MAAIPATNKQPRPRVLSKIGLTQGLCPCVSPIFESTLGLGCLLVAGMAAMDFSS